MIPVLNKYLIATDAFASYESFCKYFLLILNYEKKEEIGLICVYFD